MSVIGPRPLLVEYLPYYTKEEHHRHDVRPGLSGWAQINGRNAIDSWEEIMEKDLVKLQGDYNAMDEDSLQDNFLNVSKLNLKTFLDGTEMMEDSFTIL